MRREPTSQARPVAAVVATLMVCLMVLGAALAALPAGAAASADDPTEPSSEPTTEPTSEPTTEPAGPVAVEDAVLRWGINNESNNRAFAPGTVNLFSAGKVPDPGHGGSTISRSDWRALAGNLEVQKWNGTAWRRATWAGTSTDSSGEPLGSPTSGTFSNHHLVFSNGEGTVDAATGTAQITWDGDATVLYYSGMSMFYLSDPTLTVADGVGRLAATVQGFASSADNLGSWSPVPAETVELAVLPGISLNEAGFTADPAYRGVAAPAGLPQQTSGSTWGSFPASYVRYMDKLGTAAFWYSSGGSTDAYKIPLPVSVGWGGDENAPTPTPSPGETNGPITQPTPTSTPTPTPTQEPTAPQQTPPQQQAPTAAVDAPTPPPAEASDVESVAALTLLNRLGAPPSAASPAPTAAGALSGTHPAWWIGSLLLLAAAGLLAASRPT